MRFSRPVGKISWDPKFGVDVDPKIGVLVELDAGAAAGTFSTLKKL